MKQAALVVSAAASLALIVSACDGQPAKPRLGELDPQAGKPVTSDTIKSEQFRSWAPSEQAAFVMGRVIAADMLFRAGEKDAAAIQLEGLANRFSAADDGSLQALGFEPQRIDMLSAGLELGRADEEVQQLFADAEANLSAALAASGTLPEDTVTFLMQQSAEAYDLGVKYGEVEDAKAYQAAFGFAVAARDLISPLDPEVYGDLRLELDILVLMWPSAGPLPGRTPPPEVRMSEQFARVKLALTRLP
jgi:hypothetical protein